MTNSQSQDAAGQLGGTSTTQSFKDEVLRLAGPEVASCIQCGTCSASCSTASMMDKSIRMLIQLCLDGEEEAALSSESIWLCTSCLLCTVRCPRGIRPKAVVSALRQIYERDGRRGSDQAFEELFMGQVRDSGRISELALSALYPLYNPMASVQIMTMGIELLPKGKIDSAQDKIRGLDEMRRLFEVLK